MNDSVLDAFNHFRTILCMCPECNNIMRVSDMKLRLHGKAAHTWLDSFEGRTEKLEKQEEKFELEESALREEAKKRGQSRAKRLVKKSMSDELAKLKFNPYDIKAILHPVDFAIFNGMKDDMVRDITLVSKATRNPYMTRLHRGVRDAVKTESYDWSLVRVSQDGSVKFE